MAGDDRDRRDDLFEDLDKFFAPIRDVDFGEERAREQAPRREPERAPAAPAPAAPAPGAGDDDPYSWLREDMERDARERAAERVASERAAAERAAAERRAERPVERPRPIPEPTRVDDVQPGEPVIRVWADGPETPEPPRRRDERPVEPEPTTGGFFGEPSRADVEAAADYFADAVRGEAGGDLEIRTTGSIRYDDEDVPSAPVRSTEFGGIASLLGEIEGREVEAQPRRPRTPALGAEGMAGPSWQDPTAIEVGSDEHRSPGRSVPLAAATGFGLAVVAVVALVLGPAWFAGLAAVAVVAGQGEWFQAVRRQGLQPATAVGMASAGLILAAAYLRGEPAMLAMLPLSLTATFLWYMAQSPSHRRDIAANVGTTLLGVVYVALLAGYALLILRMDGGEGLLGSVVGLTIAYDVAAFFSGYLWGSRPLAATISPRKSWEGAIGGSLVAMAVAAGAVASTVPALDTILSALGLAVVVSVFAPIGDLAESLVKRDLGLKDMGNILPGHGGVLDRIDALLFVMPAAYLYLRIVGA
ncbi:MAG: phosphatidate cytidylyltransferase [Actinomycetota bacterium]